MTDPQHTPDLSDVPDPDGLAHPDHHEHAKTAHPPNDDELEHRVQREREDLGADGPVQP